jgi:hypothetical protein
MAARITSVMVTPPSLCGSMTTDQLFRWLSINYASMPRTCRALTPLWRRRPARISHTHLAEGALPPLYLIRH